MKRFLREWFGGSSKSNEYQRVVQIKYQLSESAQLIYIHRRVVHKRIKTKVLIRGLGKCEGFGEDSEYEIIS